MLVLGVSLTHLMLVSDVSLTHLMLILVRYFSCTRHAGGFSLAPLMLLDVRCLSYTTHANFSKMFLIHTSCQF